MTSKDNNAAPLRHPAQRLYLLTLLLLGIAVLFGFISVFVPWVMKDIAIGTRAWAYPFRTCFEDTFSIINAESCQDNDFIEPTGTPLTGGNDTCKAFVLSTIAFVFISVIGGVLVLINLLLVLDGLARRPTCLAASAQVGLVLVFITATLAWIMFICYAEKTCVEGSIFPVKGYSYGFILYIFASTLALMATVTGFMGYRKLRAFRLEDPTDEEERMACPTDAVDEPNMPVAQPTPYDHDYPEHSYA